jgi:uncharacterized protein (DUF2164 family)
MARIALDKDTLERLSRMISAHMKDELDLDVGRFEALELLDFLTETLGPHYYNQGLYDAQALFRGRVDDIIEAIHGIEKPVKL